MLDWKRIAEWNGWRRYAPTAGSLVSHGVILGALATMMAASIKSPPAPSPPEPQNLEIMLLSETPPPPVRPTPPPPRQATPADPKAESIPGAPTAKDPRKTQKQAAAQDDSVYVPPSVLAESDIPAGLRGAVMADPCKVAKGVKQKDCVTGWASRLGPVETLMPRSEEDLKRYYAEFMVTCPWKVGCGPNQQSLIQLNGAQSVVGTRMAAGPASLGGMSDTVGRLQFDPDHRDPGFGD